MPGRRPKQRACYLLGTLVDTLLTAQVVINSRHIINDNERSKTVAVSGGTEFSTFRCSQQELDMKSETFIKPVARKTKTPPCRVDMHVGISAEDAVFRETVEN